MPHNEQGRVWCWLAWIAAVISALACVGCQISPSQALGLKAQAEEQKIALQHEIDRLRAQEQDELARGDIKAAAASRKSAEVAQTIRGYVEAGQNVLAVGVDPLGNIQLAPAARALGSQIGGETGVYVGIVGSLVGAVATAFGTYQAAKAKGEVKVKVESDKAWNEAKAEEAAKV